MVTLNEYIEKVEISPQDIMPCCGKQRQVAYRLLKIFIKNALALILGLQAFLTIPTCTKYFVSHL